MMGEYAYNMGLVDYQERSKVEQIIINATFQEQRKLWDDLHKTFEQVLGTISRAAGGINVYDITKFHEYPDVLIGTYLESTEAKVIYKFNDQIEYGMQQGNVYEALYTDFMIPYTHLVEDLLSRKIYVMVYNGQNDLIVETPGTFKWVERIHYSHAAEFRYL